MELNDSDIQNKTIPSTRLQTEADDMCGQSEVPLSMNKRSEC